MFASACFTAASYGRGSILNSFWFSSTKSPSWKYTSVNCPLTRGRTATLATALTEPMVRTRTGTVFFEATAIVTGAGGASGRPAGGFAHPLKITRERIRARQAA